MKTFVGNFGELKGRSFTFNQLHEVWRDYRGMAIDKKVFPDFQTWVNDLLITGIIK